MSRICEHCQNRITENTVYCPVCGKILEERSKKKEPKNILDTVLSYIHLLISAFFEPMAFYKKTSGLSLKPYIIIPAAFYLLFFGNVISEKYMLGYFTELKAFLVFLGTILISAFLYAASVCVIFYSSKFSSGETDIIKITKTVGAGYFIPSIFAFFGFIFNIIFNFGSFSLPLAGLIFLLIPYYMITSELNKKNHIMTFIPTIITGLLNIIFISLIYGMKF